MKLLFDQNLSFKLVQKTSDIFPESSHVKFHNLQEKDDILVRQFALENRFIIVTQDSDFYDLAILHGIPPKVIWIRSGNSSTHHIEQLLRENVMAIFNFSNDSKICLELF